MNVYPLPGAEPVTAPAQPAGDEASKSRPFGVNEVRLLGRLAADPELRYTPKGTAVTRARIVTNAFGHTEFHDVQLWDKDAEHIAQYGSKGRALYIAGRLCNESWQDDAGQRHYRTYVVAQQWQLLGSRPSDG